MRKIYRIALVLSLFALTFSFSACVSKRYSNLPAFTGVPLHDSQNYSAGRFKTSYLADQIHAYFRGNASGPIAVTTFVDVNNLYQSSAFGRVLSEQLMSELAMRGYNVVELRMSDTMQVMFHSGEFSLSREISQIRDGQEVSGVVVGTYTSSPVRVYLNTRLIDPSSSMLISAGTVEMKRTKEISNLLRQGSFPTAMERIPVKHLGYSQYPAPYYYPSLGYAMPAPWNWQAPSQYSDGEWHAPPSGAWNQPMQAPLMDHSGHSHGMDGAMVAGDKPMVEKPADGTSTEIPQPALSNPDAPTASAQ